MVTKKLQIAIDGPVSAGKGTVSKLLAEKLGFLYVDTGAMYRAITYFIHSHKIDFADQAAICKLLKLKKPQVKLKKPQDDKKDGRLITVLLNTEDISWHIRTEAISKGTAIITAYKCVRDYLVPQQQCIARSQSVVMEGRDITTRVLPQADLKIYLDGSDQVRAKRRHQQMLERGELVSFEEIHNYLKQRDHQDMHRQLDPLVQAPDSWLLDTTNMTISQVVDKICDKLKTI